MQYRASYRVLTLCILVLAAVLVAAPRPAVANPDQSAMPIASENFDGTYPPAGWTMRKFVDPINPAVAYWGRMSVIKYSANYSLWCAGIKNDVPNTAWTSGYPQKTKGYAEFTLPVLADYYSSQASFFYSMKSRGKYDAGSFAFESFITGNNVGNNFTSFPLTGAGAWVPVSFSLTGASNTANLSRQSGWIRFAFIDVAEASSVTPKVGEGPSVDNVSISGFKYGPVRSPSAAQVGNAVRVSWNKPYAAVGSLSTENRTVSYRVWRKPQSAPGDPWTELTSAASRVADTGGAASFDDSSGTTGVTYRYAVIAYDSGVGIGYGEAAETTGRKAQPGLDIALTASKTAVAPGEATTLTFTLTNTGGVPVTGITVSTDAPGVSTSGGDVPTSLGAGASQAFSRSYTPAASGVVNTTATGNAGGPVSGSSSLYLTVYDPKLTVAISPSGRWANAGKSAHYKVTVNNTGNVALSTNVVLTDGTASVTLTPTRRTIAAGASLVLDGAIPVSSNKTITANVSAIAGSGQSWEVEKTGSATSQAYVTVSRISGADRYDTAIEASKKTFPTSAPAVVVATGLDYPDALSASALAGKVGGPLLLVDPTKISKAAPIKAEIERLGATKIYLVGGVAAVSTEVEAYLAGASGVTSTTRLAGASRYDTARLVANQVGSATTVFLATGQNFPDALAASSLAANKSWPILLTKTSTLPAETIAALTAIKPTRVIICGGAGAVSSAVENGIKGNAAYGSPTVTRMPGVDRYDTAKRIIDWGKQASGGNLAPNGIDGMFLATGTGFPDALAGGVLAGKSNSLWRPLMLTKGTSLSSKASEIIAGNSTMGFVTVVGGTGAVTDAVKNAALNLIP